MGALAAAGCALQDTLWWEVGVAGWARSFHGKQLGAAGGARRLGGFLVLTVCFRCLYSVSAL